MKSCFLIGHAEASSEVLPVLAEAVVAAKVLNYSPLSVWEDVTPFPLYLITIL